MNRQALQRRGTVNFMRIAVCIQNDKTVALLSQLFEEYRKQRGCSLTSRFFETEIDLVEGFTGGEYNAIFWGGFPTEQILEEIREKDGRVRLVRVAQANSAMQDSGNVWYCLSEPLGEAFVFPVLDRLLGDAAQEEAAGLLIKSRGSVMNLAFSRIRCVEVMGKNVFFHLDDGKTEEVRGTLSDFEARLLHWPDFIKVHRAYIINLRHMERMEANSILLCGGHTVPVSKHLYPQIKKDWLCGLMDPAVTPDGGGAASTAADNARRGNSILLVDDSEEDRRRFAQLLENKGCRVQTADSGEAALDAAACGQFDCVVLDVQLGEARGFDLCQDLREATDAPVIYLSTLSDSDSQLQGFLSGGIDYITKDTASELFWLKVETRIAMARASHAELSMSGLRLDLKHRRVFWQQREVFLTTVEFDLLCLLMRTPGVVYTPSRLYELVWGTKQSSDGQLVQLHMSGLWRKLENACPGQGFIETVWGTGYRFSPGREGGNPL